jgi:hypothetical protein
MEAVRGEIKAPFSTERVEECTRKINEGINGLRSSFQVFSRTPSLHSESYWIAAGLFVAFSLVCTGWFYTYKKLNEQIANDTKYRQLKLDTAIIICKFTWLAGQPIIANPNLRKQSFKSRMKSVEFLSDWKEQNN